MPKNRIKEFRLRHQSLTGQKISAERLAELVGVSQPYMSRLERNERELRVPLAERIAVELGQPDAVAEIMGFDPARGEEIPDIVDELELFEPPPGHKLAGIVGPQRKLYKVLTEALSKAKAPKGHIVAVDESPEAIRAVSPLDLVKVRLRPEEDFMEPVTLLRQYVPPKLLITNGERYNAPSIDMDEEEATIEGVVFGFFPD